MWQTIAVVACVFMVYARGVRMGFRVALIHISHQHVVSQAEDIIRSTDT